MCAGVTWLWCEALPLPAGAGTPSSETRRQAHSQLDPDGGQVELVKARVRANQPIHTLRVQELERRLAELRAGAVAANARRVAAVWRWRLPPAGVPAL